MIDLLKTMKAEIDECVELLRPHFPNRTEEQLREHATFLHELKAVWEAAQNTEH